MIRAATTEDVPLFRALWGEYLLDQRKKGSKVHASERNLNFWTNVFLMTVRDQKGIALFADDEAVLLWADLGSPQLDTDLGRIVQACGTYVRPDARGMGLSVLIRTVAKRLLGELGYDHAVGAGLAANKEGLASGFGSIGFEPYEVVGVLRLKPDLET